MNRIFQIGLLPGYSGMVLVSANSDQEAYEIASEYMADHILTYGWDLDNITPMKGMYTGYFGVFRNDVEFPSI